MKNKEHKKIMFDTFRKFNGEQIEFSSKHGFYKFSFSDNEISEAAFQEYNNLGGYSAREKNEITVFIKNEESSKIEEFKKLDFKMYTLSLVIFLYWSFAIFSVLTFCYLLPYNALTILIGIVIYNHFDCYLQ